jgi:biopolymer transport protein ExbB
MEDCPMSIIRMKALLPATVFALAALFSAPNHAQEPTGAPATAPVAAQAVPTADTAVVEEPAAPQAKLEQVANPYGMEALWKQGDFVARGVLLIMLIMSAATWYIMFVKLFDQQKLMTQARAANKSFWSSRTVADGIATLRSGSPFWYIADRGLNANKHHEGTLVEHVDLSSWITMSVNRAVDDIGSRLQGGLSVLATVGSTAPFVGLFGTVWGIYHALTAIGISGQASIDKVAGPVGEALIMTALGLAVAVPAVMGYNWLVRRNKNCMDKVRAFGADLHSVLLSGTRIGERATAPQAQANPPRARAAA